MADEPNGAMGAMGANDDTPDVDQGGDHAPADPSEDWTHLGPRCVG